MPRGTLIGTVVAYIITTITTILSGVVAASIHRYRHLSPTSFESQSRLLHVIILLCVGHIKHIGAVNHTAGEPPVPTKGRHGSGRCCRSGGTIAAPAAAAADGVASGKVCISSFSDLNLTPLLGDDVIVPTPQVARGRSGRGSSRTTRRSRQCFHGIVRMNPSV